jgi:DNA-binding MarR family transcriptional regulator
VCRSPCNLRHSIIQMDRQDIHMLRLMGELDRDGGSSQRELSQRLNLSLGLVNTFLRRLVGKGYFKVKTLPRNRLKYFLTPEGLARKTRLTAEYLRFSVNFYKDIKQLLLSKFKELETKQVKRVVFFGAGEVAELAYLYLQLSRLELVGVIDEIEIEKDFFGVRIKGLEALAEKDWDVILLTRLENTEVSIRKLEQSGIGPDRIATI